MVSVSAEYEAATSQRTPEALVLIVANLFLSSDDCPETETCKQARTSTMHNNRGKHLKFFMGTSTNRSVAEGVSRVDKA
jgi:hypothetical protein